MTIKHAYLTDVGRTRSRNEDSCVAVPELGLFVVCDGMGGHQAGDAASRRACEVIEESIRSCTPSPGESRRETMRLLVAAVRAANERILLDAESHPGLHGMGTTVVAALIVNDRAYVASVGDSRAYLIRDNTISLLTEDHSLFFELIRHGRLSRSSAARFPYKNVVTRALGMRGTVQVDVFDFELLPGDRILLCTDGLHGVLEDEELLRLAGFGELSQCVTNLVASANEAGGPDNITATLIEITSINRNPEYVKHRISSIRTFPLLAGLSTSEWIRLVSISEIRGYSDGEIIFEEGESGDGLYGVLLGEVEVRRGERILHIFRPGTHLGEISLVEETPRLVTARVRGPTEVLFISRKTFEALARQFPQISTKLLRNLVRILAYRLRSTNDELIVLKTYYDSEKMIIPTVVPSDALEELK